MISTQLATDSHASSNQIWHALDADSHLNRSFKSADNMNNSTRGIKWEWMREFKLQIHLPVSAKIYYNSSKSLRKISVLLVFRARIPKSNLNDIYILQMNLENRLAYFAEFFFYLILYMMELEFIWRCVALAWA